jgi:hypothetical protein
VKVFISWSGEQSKHIAQALRVSGSQPNMVVFAAGNGRAGTITPAGVLT